MTLQQNSAMRLPQQDLERCSVFEAERGAVAAWVDQLPLGTPARAGSELRTACAELNRVELVPEDRFALLELLRPAAHSVVGALTQSFDATWGGFGSAPKFPHAMDLRLCLRHWKRTKNPHALDMCLVSLDRMAAGGIYDHLGGGFAQTERSSHPQAATKK